MPVTVPSPGGLESVVTPGTSDWYLGPAGALVMLPPPDRDITRPLSRPSAEQVTLSGAVITDRLGRGRRKHTLSWRALTPDEASIVERLWQLPGVLILDDPSRRNRLTANQSTGSDAGRTTDGAIARFQGSLSSSTAQSRSAPRSFAWATGTNLGTTGRGIYLYNSATIVDDTWHPVRPSTAYTASGYLRSTAAVSMQAGFDWHAADGTYLSTSLGSGTALSTSNFNTRVTLDNSTSPATAAYGIPFWINTTTTGAAITVYLDDPQVEEAAAASAHVIGSGVPRVATAGEFPQTTPMVGWETLELALVEV
jgi:hypothetical protein